MKDFKNFYLMLRFEKSRIVTVPREIQLARSLEFFKRIGQLSPLLKNWYRCGDSAEDGLRFNVMENTQFLRNAVEHWEENDRQQTEYVLWNGQPDITKGGLSITYYAHDKPLMSSIEIEDAGALVMVESDPRRIFIGILNAAVDIWPEIDWGLVVPDDYYLYRRVFQDRQTIGWIGFCPRALKASDFPDADELIDVPGRGTIVVSCPQVMDQDNLEHVQRVGNIDIKLMELGYLPIFPG
ncbi:immunity 52 family protein [Pseudomonas fulva]|uniref:Imm52 family immunity protein n=1 Tax=Pseudomonas fulva TaxID=47880 RepID=UPI00201DBB3A|nr:Imm52 family immunity protein [Pseudomonas fulva]UQY36812.1 immunity 52 family protein [Pseudomonas fulva]